MATDPLTTIYELRIGSREFITQAQAMLDGKASSAYVGRLEAKVLQLPDGGFEIRRRVWAE